MILREIRERVDLEVQIIKVYKYVIGEGVNNIIKLISEIDEEDDK